MLAAVAWFFLGRGIGGYPVDVTFRDAQGTKDGADVRLAGVKVGDVRKVDVDSTGLRALLHLNIYPNRRVPTDAVYTVTSGGLLGEMFVQISPKPGGGSGRYLTPDAKPVPSFTGTDLPTFDDLRLKAAQLGDGATGVMNNLSKASARLAALSEDPAFETSLKHTANNIEGMSSNAALAVQRLHAAMAQELPVIRAMLTNAEKASASLGPITKNVNAASGNASQVVANANRLVKQLTESVVFLRATITDTLAEGEVGPNLKATMANLTEASAHFKVVAANAEKISADLASKGETTSRIGETITAVQKVTEKAGAVLDKIAGVADKAGKKRGKGFSLSPQFEGYQSFGNNTTFRADVGIAIPRGKDAAIVLGLRNLGEGNTINFQNATAASSKLQFRYGFHDGKLGVGADLALGGEPRLPGLPLKPGAAGLSIDLYRPNDPQLDIFHHGRLKEDLGLSVGLEDMLHSARPTIGLTYRQ
jgi:ABC-type transporter Mla subunit MlaD